MRTTLLAMLLLWFSASFAQSNKDMIIASWKCMSVEQAPVTINKKQKNTTPQTYAPNIDTLRKNYVGVVFGFLKNGTVAYNIDGVYDTRQYKVEGNVITVTGDVYLHTANILELSYRTMTWQDKYGIIYEFERE